MPVHLFVVAGNGIIDDIEPELRIQFIMPEKAHHTLLSDRQLSLMTSRNVSLG
jgi:hypothetical protein